ncbi:hypothetical protein FOZ63_000159 [Perkinsus olseni]|uniref:Uncharacterized protein n=1 Tax=Perkinsus olseni TaxID=32597 RepID=A0A7J6QLB6_PEROL|nr:hypothetical protein FOZ62_013862 [Perkinsus olseni]KAF4746151.1 hypothetical protein FOZ63_000159 [Perkinsus olseni]
MGSYFLLDSTLRVQNYSRISQTRIYIPDGVHCQVLALVTPQRTIIPPLKSSEGLGAYPPGGAYVRAISCGPRHRLSQQAIAPAGSIARVYVSAFTRSRSCESNQVTQV